MINELCTFAGKLEPGDRDANGLETLAELAKSQQDFSTERYLRFHSKRLWLGLGADFGVNLEEVVQQKKGNGVTVNLRRLGSERVSLGRAAAMSYQHVGDRIKAAEELFLIGEYDSGVALLLEDSSDEAIDKVVSIYLSEPRNIGLKHPEISAFKLRASRKEYKKATFRL